MKLDEVARLFVKVEPAGISVTRLYDPYFCPWDPKTQSQRLRSVTYDISCDLGMPIGDGMLELRPSIANASGLDVLAECSHARSPLEQLARFRSQSVEGI